MDTSPLSVHLRVIPARADKRHNRIEAAGTVNL
jgi:hypothetical protein